MRHCPSPDEEAPLPLPTLFHPKDCEREATSPRLAHRRKRAARPGFVIRALTLVRSRGEAKPLRELQPLPPLHLTESKGKPELDLLQTKLSIYQKQAW